MITATAPTRRHQLLGFNDRWLMLAGIPLISALTALLFAQVEYADPFSLEALSACFALGLCYTTVYWLPIRYIIMRLRTVDALRNNTKLRIALMAVSVVSIVVGVKLVVALATSLLPAEQTLVNGTQEASQAYDIIISLILCVMTVAIYESMWYFARFRDAALAQEQLAKRQMQSQLTSLRDQVNPHFLFNSLNTLASIIPEAPDKATRFVQRLSAVYRRVLEHGEASTVTLGEELDALDDYLFLMHVRFEDKLRVDIQVDPAMRALHVVPLSLQMLVENAIKHNIVSQERPLHIRIEAAPTYVRVTNTLQLRIVKETSTGIGLTNIRERYRLLGAAPIEVAETATAYTVELPLLPAQSDVYVRA